MKISTGIVLFVNQASLLKKLLSYEIKTVDSVAMRVNHLFIHSYLLELSFIRPFILNFSKRLNLFQ